MNDSQRKRLSITLGGSHHDRAECEDCPISREMEERVAAVESRISHVELEVATLSGRVIASIDGLRHELRTAMSVSHASRSGVDVENSTPPLRRGQSELDLTKRRIRVPPVWLFLIVVACAGIAAAAWTTVKIGYPTSRQQVGAEKRP